MGTALRNGHQGTRPKSREGSAQGDGGMAAAFEAQGYRRWRDTRRGLFRVPRCRLEKGELNDMYLLQCPTGEQWDRFILGESMPESVTLKEHLEICAFCAFVVSQRRRELEAVSRAWAHSPKTGVITLSIWPDNLESAKPSSLLAAQGNDKSKQTASITLSSADQQLILKAVRDAHTNETWLYLMAEDPALCRNVLVKPFGQENEYLTDPDGRINLGVVQWPSAELHTAEVRVAKAIFTLLPWKDSHDQQISSTLTTPEGDQIRVTLTKGDRNKKVEIEVLKLAHMLEGVPLKVAVREGQTSEITMVSSAAANKATVQNMEANEPIEIFLFQ